MNHFLRIIVVFISFVTIGNSYGSLTGGPVLFETEIVFDRRIFPDGIKLHKITYKYFKSEYTLINTTDIPLYFFGPRGKIIGKSYTSVPDIIPGGFIPTVKLVSGKTYAIRSITSQTSTREEWYEKNTTSVMKIVPFGSIWKGTNFYDDGTCPEQPKNKPFSIPFYYNGQMGEMTGYLKFNRTSHYYDNNCSIFLIYKAQIRFALLLIIAGFGIFLAIKTMKYFLRK